MERRASVVPAAQLQVLRSHGHRLRQQALTLADRAAAQGRHSGPVMLDLMETLWASLLWLDVAMTATEQATWRIWLHRPSCPDGGCWPISKKRRRTFRWSSCRRGVSKQKSSAATLMVTSLSHSTWTSCAALLPTSAIGLVLVRTTRSG